MSARALSLPAPDIVRCVIQAATYRLVECNRIAVLTDCVCLFDVDSPIIGGTGTEREITRPRISMRNSSVYTL